MHIVGKIFTTLLGSIFLIAGLAFSGQIVKESLPQLETMTWRSVHCTIDSFHVDTGASGYTIEIAYHYNVDGVSYATVDYPVKDTMDYKRVASIEAYFSKHSQAVCYVKQGEPTRSRISRNFPFQVFLVFFPLIFVLVGGGILIAVWSPDKKKVPYGPKVLSELDSTFNGAKRGHGSPPVLENKALFYSTLRLLAYFIVCCVGVFGSWYTYTGPFLESIDALYWVNVPCTIVQSAVIAHEDSEGGTSYSLKIVFHYEYQGKKYVSGRYALTGGEPSGYTRKHEIADSLPPGTTTSCVVNPACPAQSVLRNVGLPSFWAMILMGFTFGMIMALRQELRRRICSHQLRDRTPKRNLTLHSAAFPSLIFVGWSVIAFLWNLPFAVLLFNLIHHPPSPQNSLFMERFCYTLVFHIFTGLVVLLFWIGSIRKLFTPRITLTLSSYPFHLGEKCEAQWHIKGRRGGLSSLAFVFEGREEVRYMQGTTTITDKEVFHAFTIDAVNEIDASGTGKVSWTIPPQQMHSFSSANNSIIWSLCVKSGDGTASLIGESFECLVLPQRGMPRKRV